MIKKPWGSEVVIFEAGEARVKLLRVKPGKRLSLQYHEKKREAMMLISGQADLELGTIIAGIYEPGTKRHFVARPELLSNLMDPGRIYNVLPGAEHRITGIGTQEAVILEMAHGSDEDIVRLADDFGRATTTTTQPAGGQ